MHPGVPCFKYGRAERHPGWHAGTSGTSATVYRRMPGANLMNSLTGSDDSVTANPAAERVIRRALKILENRLRPAGPTLNSPRAVRDYLRLRLADTPHEVFV